MKMTWTEVTNIQNPRYTNRRYLCPYCTLRVSKSLDLWCVFDRLSNFEKCNLRSGHLMWPGGVTFGVIGSSFFLEMCQIVGWTAMANWRRVAPPFFRYLRKTWGGVDNRPPPGRARVNPRPAGGGGQRAPCGFSQIAPEVLGISFWNLPYLSGQQFHTLCQQIRTQVIIGQPWVTSEWRHVSPN